MNRHLKGARQATGRLRELSHLAFAAAAAAAAIRDFHSSPSLLRLPRSRAHHLYGLTRSLRSLCRCRQWVCPIHALFGGGGVFAIESLNLRGPPDKGRSAPSAHTIWRLVTAFRRCKPGASASSLLCCKSSSTTTRYSAGDPHICCLHILCLADAAMQTERLTKDRETDWSREPGFFGGTKIDCQMKR